MPACRGPHRGGRLDARACREAPRRCNPPPRAHGGRVAPRAYGSGSPNYLHDAMDRWFQQMQEEEERRANAAERNRVRLGATATEVANADMALLWPIKYLRSDLKALVTLNCFLFAKAKRLKSWQRYAERQGIARASAKRHKARAIATICDGLAGTAYRSDGRGDAGRAYRNSCRSGAASARELSPPNAGARSRTGAPHSVYHPQRMEAYGHGREGVRGAHGEAGRHQTSDHGCGLHKRYARRARREDFGCLDQQDPNEA